MNEVSTQIVALVVDALDARGVDPDRLWDGLGVDRARVAAGGRIDWTTWVAMMARVEDACGVDQMETLFVAGAGVRTGNRFVQMANVFVSVEDLYTLFARWGLRRQLIVLTGRFERRGVGNARLTISVDPAREGSLPSLRFVTGVVRHLPSLQGLPPSTCRMAPGATPHEAVYELTLPRERSRLGRLRHLLRLTRNSGAAVDELEQQATEIAVKNVELERQLAETARAAAALAERDEWLRLALEAGRVGIWRWSPSTGVVRLSDELGQWLGQPGQIELDTAAVTERIHADDLPHLATTVQAALAQGEPFDVECRVTRASGELGWLHIKGRRRPGAGGTGELLGTVVDITEKKLMDSRLRFADRLIAAGTLAAGVAHEVNNPLAYVLGTLDLVRLRLREFPSAEPALRDSLQQIGDGLARIRDVVADLRAFARPEEEVVARTEPREVCEAAIRIVSSLVRHRAAITTDHADDTPAVIANQSRLGQVVINLIVNASHAMPDRPDAENRIVVRTRRLATGEAAIEVADNGIGIAPEVLPRLFDPFFTTKGGTGTGLGLSVCQRIVGSLRGRIDVESTPGVGSTFTIALPAAPAATGTTEPPPVRVAPPAARRVLLVDDEPMIRRVLTTMLTSQGYVVVEADGGRAALARAASGEAFDVLLCDLQMPDLDGVALHAELGRVRPDLVPRVVFMSGGAVGGRTRAFAARTDIVLLDKPFTLDHLLAALDRIPA